MLFRRSSRPGTRPGIRRGLPAAVLTLLAACSGEVADEDLLRLPPLRPAAEEVDGALDPGPDLRAVANGTYQLPSVEGPIVLRGGLWEDRASGAFAQLADGAAVRGDFDVDGAEEVAVVLTVKQAGGPMQVFLLGVGRAGGVASQDALLLLGTGAQLRGIRAAEGSVEVRLLTTGPGDDLCCPSREATRSLRIRNGSWTDR